MSDDTTTQAPAEPVVPETPMGGTEEPAAPEAPTPMGGTEEPAAPEAPTTPPATGM